MAYQVTPPPLTLTPQPNTEQPDPNTEHPDPSANIAVNPLAKTDSYLAALARAWQEQKKLREKALDPKEIRLFAALSNRHRIATKGAQK